jgi:hypothetical protein
VYPYLFCTKCHLEKNNHRLNMDGPNTKHISLKHIASTFPMCLLHLSLKSLISTHFVKNIPFIFLLLSVTSTSSICFLVTSAVIGVFLFIGYKASLRFAVATDVPSSYYRKRKVLFGKVLMINDSDNLRVYHMPWAYRFLSPLVQFPFKTFSLFKYKSATSSNS